MEEVESLEEEAEEPWPYVTVQDLSFFLSRLLSGCGGISPAGALSAGGAEDLPLQPPLQPEDASNSVIAADGSRIPEPSLPLDSPPAGGDDRRSVEGGQTMEGPEAEGAWQHMMNKEIKGVKYVAWW